MVITPEKKREIDSEIRKFLLHLMAENKERPNNIDVIDLKNFDLDFDLNAPTLQLSISPR